MKKIIFFILVIICTACTDYTFTDGAKKAPEGKINVSFNLVCGSFNLPTKEKTAATDSDLDNIWALCFENPNPDTYSANAILREVVQVEQNGSTNSMIITGTDKPTFILFIGNAGEVIKSNESSLIGKTYQTVLEDYLVYGSSYSKGINPLSSPESALPFWDEATHQLNTPVPMFGESAILPSINKDIKLNTIFLSRSVSKVSVNATQAATASNFTLTGVSLANVFSKGLINPVGIESTPVNKSSRINYGKMESGKLQPLLQTIINNSSTDNPLYFFRTQQPIEVIIRGRFKGKSEERFYKVNIKEDKKLCNITYLLNILSVSNNGYATMEEAIAAPGSSGMTVDVVVTDDSHEIIANEEFFLGLSNSQYLLFADGAYNNVTIATISTNAFNTGKPVPAANISMISGTNMNLVTGQNITSNSTDIKVNFTADETAEGTIRVTVGTLARDITIKKNPAIAGNFNPGKSGIFIADNVIEAHPEQPNARLAFAPTALSADRNTTVETPAGTSLYAFVNSITGKDDIDFRALTQSGQTILVQNITDIPEFAGNNIYWDEFNDRPKFDDLATAQKENTETIQGITTAYFGSLVLYMMKQPSETYNVVKSMCNPSKSLSADYKSGISAQDFHANGDKIPFNPNKDIGDICEFMTRRGWAPGYNEGVKWRLPNFDDLEKYSMLDKKRYNQIGSFTNIPTTGLSEFGTSVISSYLEAFKLIKFPASGQVPFGNHIENAGSQLNVIFATYDRSGNSKIDALQNDGPSYSPETNYFQMRCIKDHSPGAIAPLYKIVYNIASSPKAGVITQPTDMSPFYNVYVDAGGSITLPTSELESSKGIHLGWIIDGRIYALGAKVSDIHKDMEITPYIKEVILATSNIWNHLDTLTFSNDPYLGQIPNDEIQGVFFKFGSLIAIAPNGEIINYPSMTPESVPYIKLSGTNNNLNENTLLKFHDESKHIGDICKYITDKGNAPKGVWRMPTAQEAQFLMRHSVMKGYWDEDNWLQSTGGAVISAGLLSLNTYFLPASGFLTPDIYKLTQMSAQGYYWTSTQSNSIYPYIMNLEPMSVEQATQFTYGYPVRCVKQE